MKSGNITRVKIHPDDPFTADWSRIDAMTDDEVMTAALCDPDAQPSTPEQLATARRAVNVQALRERLGLSQEQFAARFGLSAADVRDWEERVSLPSLAARTLLRVIDRDPDAVARALEKA